MVCATSSPVGETNIGPWPRNRESDMASRTDTMGRGATRRSSSIIFCHVGGCCPLVENLHASWCISLINPTMISRTGGHTLDMLQLSSSSSKHSARQRLAQVGCAATPCSTSPCRQVLTHQQAAQSGSLDEHPQH